MSRRKTRETYGSPEQPTLLPEVPVIGTDAPQRADIRALDEHTHPGAFELCLIARGSVEWWAEHTVYEVGPGDVYITKPDEPHGGVDAVLHPCELYWLTLRLPPSGRVAGLGRNDAAALAERFYHLKWRCFPGTPTLRDVFDRILAEHREPTQFSRVNARAALHELLVTMLRDHDAHDTRQQDQRARVSEPMRAALHALDTDLSEDFSVEALAERVGLSVSRFHERFRDEVGFTPAEWRSRQRITRAKQLLRDSDRPVTDIAMRCGFNTSQYFATAFKGQVGLTPRDYRAQVQHANRGR